jgi:hypothetical protein
LKGESGLLRDEFLMNRDFAIENSPLRLFNFPQPL